jgi:hypothetical protein
LSYNLRVGTTPGGSDIVSPNAGTDGTRRLPAPGNVQEALRVPLTALPLGRIYWSVQAVDSAFAGSAFAPEQSFTVGAVLGPDTGLVPGDLDGDGIVSAPELDTVLAHYFPYSPWLSLTNAAGPLETNVSFALSGAAANAFSVLVSTNLADWEYLGPATPRYEFTDTNGPAALQRYYRLSWP